MVKFNGNCDKDPIIKQSLFDIRAKLLSMGLEPVVVPADGNRLLHINGFALLQLRNKKLLLVATVAAIRTGVVGFLTNARMKVIADRSTLGEFRIDVVDPMTAERRDLNGYAYLVKIKRPD